MKTCAYCGKEKELWSTGRKCLDCSNAVQREMRRAKAPKTKVCAACKKDLPRDAFRTRAMSRCMLCERTGRRSPDGYITCTKCGENKPESDYYKKGYMCMKCIRKRSKKYNRESYAANKVVNSKRYSKIDRERDLFQVAAFRTEYKSNRRHGMEYLDAFIDAIGATCDEVTDRILADNPSLISRWMAKRGSK